MSFNGSLKFISVLIAVIGMLGVFQGGVVHAAPTMESLHPQTSISADCSVADCEHSAEACAKHCFSETDESNLELATIQKPVSSTAFVPAPIKADFNPNDDQIGVFYSSPFQSTDRLLTVIKLE